MSSKIERGINGSTTVTLRAGDFHAEYTRDADGLAYRILRSHDGSLVKRLPIPVSLFNEILVVAQQFAAAENAIALTLKKTWKSGS